MTEHSFVWNGTSLPDAGPYSDQDWWRLQKYSKGHGASRPNLGIFRGNGIYTAADGDTESLFVRNTTPVSAAILIRPGSAIVEGTVYVNDADLTLSIAANASGLTRIDTVILRKTNSAGTVRAIILQGTPAASPVPTALTQSAGVQWEIPLAYVTVATGFVTIGEANIIQSGEIANGVNAVIVDDVLNNSAITLEPGMIVVWHSGNRAVTTTTTPFDRAVAGVWLGRTAVGARGRLQVGGTALVKMSSLPTNGQFVGTGTVAGTANASDFEALPNIGRVVIASLSGHSFVQLNISTQSEFGAIAAARLSGAAANLDSGVFVPVYNGIEVEFVLRSEATPATTDGFLFRFGDSSALDATAGNYYSYAIQHSGAGPTATPFENLGAAAGIRVQGPTAADAAGLFVYGRFRMWDVRSTSGRKKHIAGQCGFRIGNATGNLATLNFWGNWENLTTRCEQIRVLTVSGSNLSADSQIIVRELRDMALP